MPLKNLEAEWKAHLSEENCPPVLGLAALSEVESDVIRQLVSTELGHGSRSQWQTLFALLQKFPASLSVWLSRKAGEAYESGAFWEKFGELVGVSIPITQRDAFAQLFRNACRKSMAVWLPPDELGGHNIVAEFLHQAGLPLDRCGGFAQHVRKVERSVGLPDIEDPESGEQLRESVLESLQPIPVPTLKRALRGPAGPRICEVALSVVLKGDFTGINPRLGQELERVFEHAGRGTLRRSAHQAFLRLGEDILSLEIVGPRQDTSLVGRGGLTWVVDGQRIPIPRTDEFLMKVTDRPRVVVELTGLVLGALPPRTFVLQLDDLVEPFILFDDRTRRQRRVGGGLPAGFYWLLHRASDTLIGAEQRYPWPNGGRALSFFEVRPGMEVSLESEMGGPWRFAAALKPFFDAEGKRLAHEAGEHICFGWSELPFIWLPAEETDQEQFAQWRVHLHDGCVEHAWNLTRSEDEAGGMVKCIVESGDYLISLSPGLHHLQLTLRRSERSRIEAQADYLYWQGLDHHDAKGFHLITQPMNLLRAECCGVGFKNTGIFHLKDKHRRHTLMFDIRGVNKPFHWPQPGIFLESLERRAGKQAVSHSHDFGEAFSASLNSDRWLRIWLAGQEGWNIMVAGQSWQHDIDGDKRDFVELGLASLAVAFPQGGIIRLLLNNSEHLIARFNRPLQPFMLMEVGDEEYKGFRFYFAEPVTWIRPVILDLAAGQRCALDGQQFETSGQCLFDTEDLPQIKCSNLVDETLIDATSGHPITLLVPTQGWAEGLWLIELEVRRDEHADWERVALSGGDHAPVVICVRNDQAVSTTRARLLWDSSAKNPQLPDDFPLDDAGCDELLELLTELIALRRGRMVSSSRKSLHWLKDAVRSLSYRAGRLAQQAENYRLQTKLLNLACQDSSHAGFVHLPGLLALPADQYRELPSGDKLNDALRLCGRLATEDSVSEAVRHDSDFLDIDVICCFANFAQVAGTAPQPEFNHFDHEQYWQSVLGILQHNQIAPDWLGEGALGRSHFVCALSELVHGYEYSNQNIKLAAANALLHCAPTFRAWLQERLATKGLMSASAWRTPWPRFVAPKADFLEAVPRFASLFALAARAAAAGLLEFDEALTWLEHKVPRRSMAEEGIAVLVGLAPELFGHQLLFWELIIRTKPQESVTL